jgi:hypothetical protein
LAYYSPSKLVPNNTEIIASAMKVFSWQINGTVSQVAYQLVIRKVSDNTVVYDSTKVSSSSFFCIISGGTLTAGTFYKWQITSYYSATEFTESEWIPFYASTAPTLTLSATPTTQQDFTFSFLYNHPNNIPVKTYRVRLTSNSQTVSDSLDVYPPNLVYSSATPITYAVTGMVNGATYNVGCSVVTQEDFVVNSGFYAFTVNYTYLDSILELIVTPQNNNATMLLEWSNIHQVLGIANGSFEYLGTSNKYIHLEPGSILTYDTGVAVPLGFTHIFQCKLPTGFTGAFLKYDNLFEIGYTGTKFYYRKSYRNTAGVFRDLPADWFIVGIQSSKVMIFDTTYTEILI